MDNILTTIITNAPNLLGLLLLAIVLYRQNEKMLNALLERVVQVEKELGELKTQVATGNSSVVPPRSGGTSVPIAVIPRASQ